MKNAKIKAIAPWFGGKRTMAPLIVEQLGKHVADSRSGFAKHGNGSKYKHELEHDNPLFGDDHSRLAEMLRAYHRARIVVSYYDHPRIRDLYAGWTMFEHTRQKQLHAQNGRGARPKDAPELLILNGPSHAR